MKVVGDCHQEITSLVNLDVSQNYSWGEFQIMPRVARIVLPGMPHHITQRGNNKQDVFNSDQDRELYLGFLDQESRRYGLTISGYCLMINHVHIVGTPETARSMRMAIGRTNYRYSMHFNKLYNRCGHLWQGRYFSCVLDEEHFVYALRYVDLNPVRASLVSDACDYPWSSATAHTGQTDISGLLDLEWWNSFQGFSEWCQLLQLELPKPLLERLRKHSTTGRPLGSDEFVKRMEARKNHRLHPLPIGRPCLVDSN
jgi:putative transposase